jgi:hypothetical protein
MDDKNRLNLYLVLIFYGSVMGFLGYKGYWGLIATVLLLVGFWLVVLLRNIYWAKDDIEKEKK